MRDLVPTPAKRSVGREIRKMFAVMAGFIAVLWGLEFLDVAVFQGALDGFGIRPRTGAGLLGVLAAPFLHGDWAHLVGNTVGILLLGGLTLAVGRREFIVVTVVGALIGGLGTWAVGRPAIHIGASGLVFAYLGYLMLRGWYDRRVGSVLLAGAVAWVWGGMVFGMFPGTTPSMISWEGHLFGFLGGVLAARLLHKRA